MRALNYKVSQSDQAGLDPAETLSKLQDAVFLMETPTGPLISAICQSCDGCLPQLPGRPRKLEE